MRVYFHLVSWDDIVLDDTGIEVSDVATAQQEAVIAIYELRQEADLSPEEWIGWQLEAVDVNNNVLFSIPLDVELH
jgi:hypothetical protein